MISTKTTSKRAPGLLLNLTAEQSEMGFSDYEWADLLKIARPTWTLARNKKTTIGLTILQAVAKAFPPTINEYGIETEPGKFDADILKFLRNGVK